MTSKATDAVVLCHHCATPLLLGSRSVAVYLPCCDDEGCKRARKRRYAAEARARRKSLAASGSG